MKKQIYPAALILSLVIPMTSQAFDQSSPPDSLVVSSDGNVGIGTSAPAKGLHIARDDGNATIRAVETASNNQKRYQIQLENNGPTGFRFTNSSNSSVWQFSQTPAGGFTFANTANGGQDFAMNSDGRVLMGPGPMTNFNLSPTGDLVIPNGSVTATAHISSSSRAAKKDFAKVDASKVMENIKALEVTEWRYKDENTKGRHIGPMAEEFYAMFGLGPDDKHVAATDMASIALIAAKELQKKTDGFNVKTEALNTEMANLKTENAILKQRLASLEKLVTNLASGQSTLPESGNQNSFKPVTFIRFTYLDRPIKPAFAGFIYSSKSLISHFN